MIVAVKTNTRKRNFIKLVIGAIVAFMFISYYFHMSEQFAREQEKQKKEKLELIKEKKKKQKTNRLEKMVYREIETAVDLIGQKNVYNIKLIKNKALIVVAPETNLDALNVRYGSAALIKKDLNDTKIAVDLKYILESKSNEK